MMNHNRLFSRSTYALLTVAAIVFWVLTGFTLAEAAPAPAGQSSAASVLRDKHVELRDALASNPFARPLVLESRQNSKTVDGEIYAVVPHAFAKVSSSLAGPRVWCDILFLHQNTKYCGISRERQTTALLMNVGKKVDQPLEDSFRLAFNWRLATQSNEYLKVDLTAESGPFGTRDYRITLEAIPLEGGMTFLHLSYSYGFGLTGKLAMQAYLGTIGRNKVGFTTTSTGENGQPVYVDGMRGLVERNTMRYYLAIESFLGALAVPERAQFEKRISDWFNAAERYPRQLHEMEREDYLSMKRREYRRQQTAEKTGLADLS